MAIKQTQVQLRKWGSLSAMIINASMPGFYLFYFCAIPIFTIATWYLLALIISTWCLILEVRFFQFSKDKQCRKLNTKNDKEREIDELVNSLAIKLKIAKPTIWIELNQTKQPDLRAQAIGWPFTNKLIIAENLIHLYLNGLSKESFEAMLAHELSHIYNNDSAYAAIDKILSLSFVILVGVSLFCAPSLLSLPIIMLTSLGLINELASKMFKRARELLADSGAVEVTKQPKNVKRFLYDMYLQYLHWGQIVIENEFAHEKWLMSQDKTLQKRLKSVARKLSQDNYEQTYQELVKADQYEQIDSTGNSSLLWQAPHAIYQCLNGFKASCLTWFNTHPTLDERVKNIPNRLS